MHRESLIIARRIGGRIRSQALPDSRKILKKKRRGEKELIRLNINNVFGYAGEWLVPWFPKGGMRGVSRNGKIVSRIFVGRWNEAHEVKIAAQHRDRKRWNDRKRCSVISVVNNSRQGEVEGRRYTVLDGPQLLLNVAHVNLSCFIQRLYARVYELRQIGHYVFSTTTAYTKLAISIYSRFRASFPRRSRTGKEKKFQLSKGIQTAPPAPIVPR